MHAGAHNVSISILGVMLQNCTSHSIYIKDADANNAKYRYAVYNTIAKSRILLHKRMEMERCKKLL